MRPVLAALLMLVAALAPSAALAGVHRYAVIVGANYGGDDLEPLRYAEDDARRMARVLTELGGFEPGDVTLLLATTPAQAKAAIAKVGASARGEDLFLFYYSGHADARGLRLGRELYPFDALKADIRAVNADVHLGILDACRSGTITRVKGATVVDPFLDERLDTEGEAWITASSDTEKAQESDQLQSSFFTYYLVSGLRGAADTGDGAVSLNEAYTYAYARTVERTTATQVGAQHPAYDFRLQGQGDLQLTSLDRASARVTLPAETAGTVLILREPEGVYVAEVVKTPGKPMVIALEPGLYRLRRRESGRVYEVLLNLSQGANHTAVRWGEGEAEITGWKGEQGDGETLDTLDDPVAEADPPSLTPGLDAWSARAERFAEQSGVLADRSQDAVQRSLSLSEQLQQNKPHLVAAGFSTLVPGAGQLYQKQWKKGAVMLGSSALLLGSGVALRSVGQGGLGDGSLTGPNPAYLLGVGVWGWSVSDAALHGKPDGPRPLDGYTLSAETAWWRTMQTPYTAGVAADFMLRPGLSIGLDRTGYTRSVLADGGMFAIGGRVMLAKDWERLRPGVFVATGLRAGYFTDPRAVDPFTEEPLELTTPDRLVRLAVAAGVNTRLYLNDRYFVSYELRYELDGHLPRLTHAGGVGVHLGR